MLTNVALKLFPPNCTSLIQPLDQGAIKCLKHGYRSRLIRRILLNTEHGRDTKVDLFMAVQMLAAAWMSTGRDIIKNCFVYAESRHGELTLAGPSDTAANEEYSRQGGSRNDSHSAGNTPESQHSARQHRPA